MTPHIPDDLKALLGPAYDKNPDKRPIYWIWTYDGEKDKATILHNEDRHPAHTVTHKDMDKDTNPDYRVEGYVYSIKGGYRITDADSKPLKDPHIIAVVKDALKKMNQ